MHSLSQHDNEITRYLLGEMEEPELVAIESRLMADNDFFAEIRAFEDELIDSYLNGELSAPQEKRFREHFLRTPARQQQLQFAQALRKNLRKNEASPPPTGIPGSTRAAAPWVIVALLVLCAIEGLFVGRFMADLRRAEQHVTELNRKLQDKDAEREREKKNSLVSSAIHIVALQPVTRASGKEVSRGAVPVVLELQLPSGEPGNSFDVEIQDQHRKTVARFNNLPAAAVDTTRVVFVPLQPETVPDGDFNVVLQSNPAASGATPLRYSFSLVRP
jgi:hypothetical protein